MKATFDRKKKAELENEIVMMETSIKEKRQEILALVTSPKVGDVIEITEGWSYKGKKMQVTAIRWSRWGSGLVAVGFLFKKDGTLGLKTALEELE